jgi:hypothetical protein
MENDEGKNADVSTEVNRISRKEVREESYVWNDLME